MLVSHVMPQTKCMGGVTQSSQRKKNALIIIPRILDRIAGVPINNVLGGIDNRNYMPGIEFHGPPFLFLFLANNSDVRMGHCLLLSSGYYL